MKIRLRDCFDQKGNLLFDPYRFNEEDETPTRIALKNLLFKEDGYLSNRVELANLIDKSDWSWNCDAIGLYHAEQLAYATKGSYPTFCYFR